MKKSVLVFPNTAKLVEYILAWKKFDLVVNFSDRSVTGELSDIEIRIACAEYGASIKDTPIVKE